MAAAAARQAGEVVGLMQSVTAMHLLLLCQAADLRGADNLAPGTRQLYDAVRQVSPYVERDRELRGDIARVSAQIAAGHLDPYIDTNGDDDGYSNADRPAARERTW